MPQPMAGTATVTNVYPVPPNLYGGSSYPAQPYFSTQTTTMDGGVPKVESVPPPYNPGACMI